MVERENNGKGLLALLGLAGLAGLALLAFRKAPYLPYGLKGDMNNDGILTEQDLSILSDLVNGRRTAESIAAVASMSVEEVLWRADVNDDGAIDLADISALEAIVAGLLPPGDSAWVITITGR